MQLFLSLFLVFTSLAGVEVPETEQASQSVEIGIAELSPLGEVGGYAIPASGCGSPGGWRHNHGRIRCSSPTIGADPILLRKMEDSVVTWTTGGWPGCVLSDQFGAISPDRASKEETFTITGETVFSIDCGAGGSDSVTVYILPELEES